MFSFKNYTVLCVLLYVSFLSQAMDKNHILNNHAYDKTIKDNDPIINNHTQVLNVTNEKGDRKSLFQNFHTKEKLITLLDFCNKKNKALLFNVDSTVGDQKRTIEYRQEEKNVFVYVKGFNNFIITAYPILRYIFSKELNQNKDSVYIATMNNKDITRFAKTIKKYANNHIDLGNNILAVKSIKTIDQKTAESVLEKRYFVDISTVIFPDIKNAHNLVIVEIDVKNKIDVK